MLEGKKILVAGAGGLLGSQVVKTLLEQNATVIASDNNYEGMQKRLIERDVNTKTQHLLFEQLNLNDEQQVIAFFERMDILDGSVNCSYPRNKAYGKHFFDVKLSDFNDNVSLHLGSSFLFMQQCAALFLKNRKPFSLVNIASIYGVIAPDFDIYKDTPMTMPVEYAAIKSGLIHLLNTLPNIFLIVIFASTQLVLAVFMIINSKHFFMHTSKRVLAKEC
ncbi:flagellin modification protein A [Legionella pneumophila]|uniref:SDR family NAD(P)-dependent oxidoreductase n=1 Tax=Legionella pneumophila TaxID=446 RepID=UPI000E005E2F|nr:flagellin modification protein A [Legionella pneumophila]